MSKKDEALKLALEALEPLVKRAAPWGELDWLNGCKAITALREALTEQPRLLSAAPCDQCGYNGPGYYQPKTHPCASKHHKALAEQPAQQEPVNKYCCHLCFNKSGQVFLDRMILCPECGNKRCPKATHHGLPCTKSNDLGQKGSIYDQPAQRTWVGLTDEEIDNMVEVTDLSGAYYYDDLYAVVRAAEAKLRSKNEDRN